MSLQRKTAEAFQLLALEQLPEEWVVCNWEQNFCESTSLPSQASENLLRVQTWRSVVEACREWLNTAQCTKEEDTGGVGFWSTLMDCEVSHQSLLALIFCLLDRKSQTIQDVGCAVCAAQTYLLLLQMPGSTAFRRKLFQPIIFQKTLNVFYLLSGAHTGQDNSGVEGEEGGGRRGRGGGRGRQGRRRNRKRRARGEMVEEGNVAEESVAVEETSMDVLSQSSENERRALASQLAVDLLQFTESCPLSASEVTRDQLVQVALHLLTRHTVGTTLTTHTLTESGHSCPVEVLGWKTLTALTLSQHHGQTEKIVTEIFLQLLPTVLMLNSDGSIHSSSSSLPHSLTTLSNNAIIFVCHLVRECGDVVMVPLKGLVQQVCTKTPDRAEYRSRMATVVCKLLTLFPDQLYSQLLEWLYRLSRTVKVSHRVFSLEVISVLLTQPLRQPQQGSLSGDEEYRLSYKYLLKTALSRCSDKAPSVRGRALSCIAASASSERPEVISTLQKCLSSQTATDPLVAGEKDALESLIVPMVRRRTRDEKVGVRKSALQALEAIIRLDVNNINREDVLALHERCMDRALSVRKLALVSLSSLTSDLPHCAVLHELWLDGVLPMVMDKEVSVQEKCISILETIILNNIAPLRDKQSPQERFVWDLLSLVAEEDRMDLGRYVRRAMEVWSKQGKLNTPLVRAVCSHTASATHEKAAWTLLAEMSQYIATSLDSKFIFDNWKLHSSAVSMETTAPLVQILIIIGNITKSLARIALEDIKDDTVAMLNTFQLSPVVMKAAITTLSQICASLATRKNYQAAIDKWCVPLLKKCEEYFSTLIDNSQSGSGVEVEEKEGTCYMFATGELCQLSPRQTSSHLSLMIHSLLMATRHGEGEKGSFRSLSQSSQLSGLSHITFSPSLRALGYITLGKLCLQNEELTKKVVPQLAHELQTSPHAATRNNIVVVLCDLAVRYSVKVDPYIPSIAVCLKDESLLVRRQTLTLLANLIQEDYIKWKGSLFFRFISTLLDEELRLFAEFCLVHLLLARNQNMFFQHFIECVFHFNGYEKHRVYNKFKQTEREKELFSLKGGKHREHRMKLYTFLLSHMIDTQRFQLLAKLCQEVLGGVVDKLIQLDESSIPVVQDTLAILTSKEIKLSSLRRNMGEELADEGDHIGAVVAIAQTKIISQIVKKNVIENVVPIIIAAKHLFEKEHSPLLKDLLLYLKEMMQDFRSEVNEILAADKQLAEEIEFDLKRVEEEQKKASRAVHTPLAATPHAQMVSPLLTPCPAGSPGTVLTPPRLRTPSGTTGKTGRTGMAILKTPRIAALKTPLPRIISPLAIHRVQKPPPFTNPPLSKGVVGVVAATPQREDGATTRVIAEERGEREKCEGEEGRRDETTPAAARARASLVNTSYVPELMTPLFAKTKSAVHTPHNTKRSQPLRTDETVLHGDIGRVASTPEGLAECISFNVSSVVPPSPIPANSNPDCYLTRRSARQQARKPAAGKMAAIMMLHPCEEPRKLDKWRLKAK